MPTDRQRCGRGPAPARAVAGALLACCLSALEAVAHPRPHDPSGIGHADVAVPDELPDAVRVAAEAAQAAPGDTAAALTAARLALDHARRSGNADAARLALRLLDRGISGADARLLNLAASARQYLHDFDGARALLDNILTHDPNNAQALLSRANILVVQGKLGEASRDCQRLASAGRFDLEPLCETTVLALSADAGAAQERLESALLEGRFDPALVGYAHSLLAEIAAFNQQRDQAAQHFEAALQADPEDLRARLLFADFRLATDDPPAALALLAGLPAIDSVEVRRAIAFKSLRRGAELEEASRRLEANFRQDAAAGDSAHAREEARFWLDVVGDAEKAVEAAKRNWAVQRELEDALLLVRSAATARQPEAAQPVRAWAEAEGVVTPALSRWLAAEADAPAQ
jgi:tetratricopeptide (TPR) repeat protein